MTGRSKHMTAGKASFDHIYNLDDPRGYLGTLRGLAYRTPHYAQPIIQELISARRDRSPITVTDLCCSYGIIAALVKHDLTLDDLYDRYTSEDLADLTTDEMAVADEPFYKDHRLPEPPRVVGVDVADRAVEYALRVGLLDEGAGENLEAADPSPSLAEAMAPTDLVTVTGGVGYISGATFDRVLRCVAAEQPPWVAAFPLRTVAFEPFEEVLASYGLVTERLDATFPQRRCVDETERDRVLDQLAQRGIDPRGCEDTGYLHAQLYLARPPADVEAQPLAELLAGST